MKRILEQIWKFVLVSGIGYVIDWLLYFVLLKIGFDVKIGNFISMSIAASYVFLLSSKKIFQNENSKLDIKVKYVVYILYQIILITLSSFVIMHISIFLTNIMEHYEYFEYIKYAKYLAKIINTPITLIINFIVMKSLIEKL